MLRLLKIAAVAAAAIGISNAAVDITVEQEGANVVATFEGNVDLTGATSAGGANGNPGVNGSFPALNFLPVGFSTPVDFYLSEAIPTFGSAPGFNAANLQSGDSFVINLVGGNFVLGLAQGSNGGAIAGDMTWLGATIAGLSLIEGQYSWLFNDQRITLTIGDSVMDPGPVPAAALLFAPALLGGLAASRRRK